MASLDDRSMVLSVGENEEAYPNINGASAGCGTGHACAVIIGSNSQGDLDRNIVCST